MYFSIGAHEGYRCPMDEGEQFTDYELIFEKTENVDGWKMEGPLRRGDLYPFMRDTDTVTLDYSYFATDAVVLTSHVSRALTLKSKKSGRGVEVKFPDFPMLGIWTRPNAPYICIEPWWGVCDAKDHNGRLEDRFGIQRLNGGEKFSCRHTIRPF